MLADQPAQFHVPQNKLVTDIARPAQQNGFADGCRVEFREPRTQYTPHGISNLFKLFVMHLPLSPYFRLRFDLLFDEPVRGELAS